MRILFAAVLAMAVLALAYYISEYHYQLLMIQGRSMEPSYHPFQIVVIDKHLREYSKGDAVVFSCDEVSVPLIKRVAACQG
ncbi:MAG: S24/S26 family peptidase, partial [Oscillospiraceae bacterium]|nr:S24/S26 family peptidase [Oscillospiraceae bacterium]